MAGTRANLNAVRDAVVGYSNAAVTANLFLIEYAVPWKLARLGAVSVNAATAGTGGGNTVVDVLINNTSIYTTTANRPTLAATSTGEFTNLEPDGSRIIRAGDLVSIKVLSISSTGHARLAATVGVQILR